MQACRKLTKGAVSAGKLPQTNLSARCFLSYEHFAALKGREAASSVAWEVATHVQ